MDTLNDAVVKLHDIARQVENELGRGKLSQDLRDVADRLNVLITPMKFKDHNNVQDIF